MATSSVTFQSIESKTTTGDPVYNEISWEKKGSKEIWMMRQSHHGRLFPKNKWDRLAIVVENGTAQFYQLPPGKLEWSEKIQPIAYKVSCFMCHPNGPRAIRAAADFEPSFKNKLLISLYNTRIKLYGRIKSQGYAMGNVPFRYTHKIDNEQLKLEACLGCHNENGVLSRGNLYRQNAVTIHFLAQNGHMPPFGKLSAKDQKYLADFTSGL